jgi:hypothetical protein
LCRWYREKAKPNKDRFVAVQCFTCSKKYGRAKREREGSRKKLRAEEPSEEDCAQKLLQILRTGLTMRAGKAKSEASFPRAALSKAFPDDINNHGILR